MAPKMSIFNQAIQNLPRPPPKSERQNTSKNPIELFRALTWMQYLMFFSGFVAWSMDAFDFFSLSLTANRLAKQFGKDTTDITTAITLTLLFRSLGALLFGLASDRYGRKWPLVVNLVIVAVFELATGFVNDYSSFLAVRSLFGVAMGGIWGLSAATGLENMPVQCRGVFSGILQEGYAFGYLLAASVNLSLVENTNNWRTIFWLGAGLSLFAAILRALLPESEAFLRAKAHGSTGKKNLTFLKETGRAVKASWWRCIFSILLMTGFNFFSHGSQDLYPVYLENAKGISTYSASVATIIGNLGAITGGIIFGALSQYLGRRLTIILACIWTGAWIPLWIIPGGFSPLAAGAFMVQVGVQGAWGVIPIYLNELSPPAYRAVFPGLAYQLGNMASSASSQIEATAGKHLRTFYAGQERPDYGRIQGIFIGVVAAYIILLCLIGPEYHGSHFEEAKVATQDGAGAQAEREKVSMEKKAAHHDEEAQWTARDTSNAANNGATQQVSEPSKADTSTTKQV